MVVKNWLKFYNDTTTSLTLAKFYVDLIFIIYIYDDRQKLMNQEKIDIVLSPLKNTINILLS